MAEIKTERVIALLAQRRGELGHPERKSLLESCRDAPGRVALHLESLGVARARVGPLVDEGTRIADRAASIAGTSPLASPADRTLRDALREGILDRWGLCAGLVDHACGGPPPELVAQAHLARPETIVAMGTDDGAVVDRAGALLSRTDRDAPVVHSLPPLGADAPRIGRYPVTGRLGAGGMGEVLCVRDGDLGREVAVKVIRGRADERQLWKFVLEARITGRLAHPSIVPVYELGRTAEGQLYFTMKRIEGRTLTAVLADAPSPSVGAEGETTRALDHRLIERLAIVQKVCDAVAFAHSQGVIHRDLKPDNVMVGGFGEVLVCDWGLAKVIGLPDNLDLAGDALVPTMGEGERVVTLDGDVMGTPAYMPPEQAEGRVELIDERADVYALGAILYQVLCGHPPYEGPTVCAVLEQVCTVPPVPPSERVAAGRLVPWELEAVAAKAMARQRGARYDSVSALRADLDAFLAGRLLSAASYTSYQRALKWARRNARALGAGAVALVSLIGALGYTAISARRQVRELEAAERTARAAEHTAETERDQARTDRTLAVASYAEARRMGAVHRVRALERERADELWWTRLDRATGNLSDEPTTARVEAALLAIARWCGDVDTLSDDRAAYAAALAAGEAERDAAPEDAWLSFRAGILAELCAGLDRLARARAEKLERGRAYEAVRHAHAARASAWATARAGVARNPRYGGLELEPQVGLVPLGEDPATGLWEFGVEGSGDLPERMAGAALPIGDRTAIVLVLIPAGEYLVGAQPDGGRQVDPQATPIDGPEQLVRLHPYFIARTELTQFQWMRLGGKNSTNPSLHAIDMQVATITVTERHPVENVSWNECAERLAQSGLVLPSEAQWEAAARAGRTAPWWTGADASALARADNLGDACAGRVVAGIGATEVWDDGYFVHAPVASYPDGSNPFGLFDVHGNVREWCRDPFDVQPMSRFLDAHGDGPVKGEVRLRASRGGSWYVRARHARSSDRAASAPANSDATLGVRVARTVTGVSAR